MAVNESISTTAILFGLTLEILLLSVIIVRITSGFMVLADQANILKFTGNIACTMVVSKDNTAYFTVKLPSGNIEVNYIDIPDGPGVLSIYSEIHRMAIPQYVPIMINRQTGRIVSEQGGIVGYILAKYENNFQPEMKIYGGEGRIQVVE